MERSTAMRLQLHLPCARAYVSFSNLEPEVHDLLCALASSLLGTGERGGTVLLVSFVQCAALLLPFWPETCRALESLRPPAVKGVSRLFRDTGSGAREDRASGSVSSPRYTTWLCLAKCTALLCLALRLRCPFLRLASRLRCHSLLHQPEAALVLPVAPGLDPGVPALTVDSRECSTQRGKPRVQRPFWPQRAW